MKTVTCTNGNKKNGISGSRVTIWNSDGTIQDRFEVPKMNGKEYCRIHKNGKYGQRFTKAMEERY